MQQACPLSSIARAGKDLGTRLYIRVPTDMVGSTCFAGVAALTLIAPFEMTAPLLRLPRQSVSNLELAVLSAFVCGAASIAWSRRLPAWRTRLTMPWLVVLGTMFVASLLSPVSRAKARCS
jgi:hypothetical protein